MTTSGQEKIWDYFQDQGVESFSRARPRLRYLSCALLRLAKRTGLSRPDVLNIGIGNGYLEQELRNAGATAVGLDPSETAVQRLAAMGITGYQGRVECLPLPDSVFDFVIASEVLEHLSDAERIAGLKEIHRVLRCDGVFLGTVPYQENLADNVAVCPGCGHVFHRWGHQKSFSVASLQDELERFFRVERIRRMAFVDFSRSGVGAKVKSLVRLILGRLGQPIAWPNLFFIARKRSGNRLWTRST